MDNRDIVYVFESLVSLMELHDHDPRKSGSYSNANFNLERLGTKLREMSDKEILSINGVGPSIAKSIHELLDTGTLELYEELRAQTAPGLIELLGIRGIGAAKVKLAWKELGIDSVEKMLESIRMGTLQELKGFGQKTVENLHDALGYHLENKDKVLLPEAIEICDTLINELYASEPEVSVTAVGEVLLKRAIINKITLLVGGTGLKIEESILKIAGFNSEVKTSGPYAVRGTYEGKNVEFLLCTKDDYQYRRFMETGSENHFQICLQKGLKVSELDGKSFSESEFYKSLNCPPIPYELKEGVTEFSNNPDELLKIEELKGILHCHSTYSDGANTLREMAETCRTMGYEYLGIADHSKSAFYYANGMYENKVLEQHKEIDLINAEMAPFRIFKGIESDILPDGELDYDLSFLKNFDFVVASIHSVMNMDSEKATKRVMTAIENPYTTILGHLTARVLLQRRGIPVDHKKIIEHCAEHNVVIEINAHPSRLDLDWHWVPYAMELGVILSVNPDAHTTRGLSDMKYGVWSGRKGGLNKASTLNAMDRDQISDFFVTRLKKKQSG